MAVDKCKPLKIENASLGGTENDPFPREMDPSEDYAAVKGISFEGNETALDWADSGLRKFKDSEVITEATLKDAIERIKRKDVDLTNLTIGYVLTWNTNTNRFELQATGALSTSIVQSVTFAKQGNTTVGSYLRQGEVSGLVGWPYRDGCKIVAIYIEALAAPSSNTTFQVQKRTAVGTYTDITNATVVLPSTTYKGDNDPLDIDLNTGESLLVYNKSGATVNTPIVTVFMVPQ
jgi:hypothetical protein